MLSRATAPFRMIFLLALGAWAVHQLRYALAFGGEASARGDVHAHGYLDYAGPVLGWGGAIAAASWVLTLRRDPGTESCGRSARETWIRVTVALILIYSAQEIAEGLLAPEPPNVVAGVFGAGGWLALPLSIAIGAIIALFVRGACAVRTAVARAQEGGLSGTNALFPGDYWFRASASCGLERSTPRPSPSTSGPVTRLRPSSLCRLLPRG